MLGKEGKAVGEYTLRKFISKDENGIEAWSSTIQNEGNAKYRILVANKESLKEKEKLENFFGMKDIYTSLQSDSILIPKDLIETKNNYYIVIQYMESPSLEELLQKPQNRAGFTVSRTLKLLQQLCDAAIHINSKNIFHRGITPKAVYINEDKLFLDGFLMSKASERPLQTLISGVPFTSPEVYMSMEYDSRIDIWGVGIVAYHMLFGCSPWKIQSQDPGKMNEQWNSFTGDRLIIPQKDEIIPDRLIEFLRRTIEKDLNKRWDWEQFKAFYTDLASKRITATSMKRDEQKAPYTQPQRNPIDPSGPKTPPNNSLGQQKREPVAPMKDLVENAVSESVHPNDPYISDKTMRNKQQVPQLNQNNILLGDFEQTPQRIQPAQTKNYDQQPNIQMGFKMMESKEPMDPSLQGKNYFDQQDQVNEFQQHPYSNHQAPPRDHLYRNRSPSPNPNYPVNSAWNQYPSQERYFSPNQYSPQERYPQNQYTTHDRQAPQIHYHQNQYDYENQGRSPVSYGHQIHQSPRNPPMAQNQNPLWDQQDRHRIVSPSTREQQPANTNQHSIQNQHLTGDQPKPNARTSSNPTYGQPTNQYGNVHLSDKGTSALAPIYKKQIYGTVTMIDDFCTNDILNDDNDESIEMTFRLLLMVAIKLYLQVIKKLEKTPIDGLLEASLSVVPKKSGSLTDKENEQLVIQRNSLRVMWRNNIKYLNSQAIMSTIGNQDEQMLKSTQDIIDEKKLREMGKQYLLKVFRKYTLKNDRLKNQEAEKIEDMITSVYVTLYLEFNEENHMVKGTESALNSEMVKLGKRALPSLVKEINIAKP